MTDTIESLQAEVTRLKAHADDLLVERRAEKQRREAAENTLATLQMAHDGLVVKLDDLTLAGPVLRALEGVTAAPPAQGRKLLEEAGIAFVIGKEGTAVAMDGDVEIPLPDLHAHLSKKCGTPEGMASLGWIVRAHPASGGGAVGGGTPDYSNPSRKPAAPAAKPAAPLGLR